jgi:hypothetical protein
METEKAENRTVRSNHLNPFLLSQSDNQIRENWGATVAQR